MEDLREELSAMSMKELREKAAALGADERDRGGGGPR